MRGLNDGEYQFVPPCVPGSTACLPASVGLRISHRSSVVEAEVPVLLHERFAEQELAGRAIEHVSKPLRFAHSITLRGRAFPVDVGEHRHLHRVPVELVVRRELVVPLQLPVSASSATTESA